MKQIYSLISAVFLSFGLMACGAGSPQPTQAELNAFWAASSLKYQLGDSSSTSPEGNKSVIPDETVTKQVMVGGTIAGEGSGSILISIHETEACAKGYCPVESKAPLASTQMMAPGYFSLVVPSQGQKLTLVAKRGELSGMRFLGELTERVEGIELKLE